MKKFLLVAVMLCGANTWCMDMLEGKTFLERQREALDRSLFKLRRQRSMLRKQGKKPSKELLLAFVLGYLSKEVLDLCQKQPGK